ncbi:RNA polymerase sigma factor [Paenibacillus sp. CN-4]|uniref:RNA polymerase sigma factor n=1 Tax=Paenibacillus nanchangensis TaxID=3348343 RepID=UPI00397A288E
MIAKLYEGYYPLMKKKAFSIIQDNEVVDDLIQDAFMKLIPRASLLKSLDCYRTTSYIVNTIKHVCFDYIRKSSRHSKNMYIGANDDLADHIPDRLAATEEDYIKGEKYDTLKKAMFQLTERDRNLLYFKYKMEMGDQQIGQLLNIRASNIRQYVARARRRILQILSEEGVNID